MRLFALLPALFKILAVLGVWLFARGRWRGAGTRHGWGWRSDDDLLTPPVFLPRPGRDDQLPSAQEQREKRMEAAAQAIARFDPDWNEAAFLAMAARSCAIATRVRLGLEGRKDLSGTLGFLSSAEGEARSASLEGKRFELPEHSIEQAVLFDFREDAGRLLLVVRTSSLRRVRTVDAGSGIALAEDPPGRRVGEFWSFVRPISTAERASGSSPSKDRPTRCPGCGAPFPRTFVPACDHCGSPLPGWPAGWFVAGVSPTSAQYQIL